MSRIGNTPVKVPSNVKVSNAGDVYNFEGPKGKLSHEIPAGIMVSIADDVMIFKRDDNVENAAALHGLTRTLMNNCVQGVSQGFKKVLEINGVGYRAQVQGNKINLVLGFSHPVEYPLPEGLTAKVDKNTVLTIMGADKQVVGQVAANIRSLRPVEPYQGKGIRYRGEHVIRKAGKAAGGKSA